VASQQGYKVLIACQLVTRSARQTLETCLAGNDEEVHAVEWQPLLSRTYATPQFDGDEHALIATSSRDRSIKVSASVALE
jgi:hypothetical protein